MQRRGRMKIPAATRTYQTIAEVDVTAENDEYSNIERKVVGNNNIIDPTAVHRHTTLTPAAKAHFQRTGIANTGGGSICKREPPSILLNGRNITFCTGDESPCEDCNQQDTMSPAQGHGSLNNDVNDVHTELDIKAVGEPATWRPSTAIGIGVGDTDVMSEYENDQAMADSPTSRPTTAIDATITKRPAVSLRIAADVKIRARTVRMALIYEKVISVISLPPSKRLDSQVQALLPWFEKKSDIFRSLEKDTLKDIIRNCEFLTCEENDIIIKQGEKGDCFYVLLRGSVGVYINAVISDADDPENITEDDAPAYVSKNGYRKATDKAKFGNFIAHIPAGKSFGELALISKDCIRNASIIADGTCDLLVVNRDLYNRSIRSAQEKDFEERRQFIEASPLFNNWPNRYKRQLAMSLRKERLNFETVIMKQGDPVSALYFIHRGQGKIIMDTALHCSHFPVPSSVEHSENHHHDHHESGVLMRPRKEITRPSSGILERRRNSCVDSFGYLKGFQRGREICLIGTPDVVGDIEVVSEVDTYIQTVVCSQRSEIFVLDMRNFERLVVKKMPKTLEMMKESAILKLESRIARVHEEEMPLLPWLLKKLVVAEPDVKAWLREEIRPDSASSRRSNHVVPNRGPLIDQYAPGTVFHRIRERGRSKDDFRKQQKETIRPLPHIPMKQFKDEKETPDSSASGSGSAKSYDLNSVKSSVTTQRVLSPKPSPHVLSPRPPPIQERGIGVWQNGKAMSELEARILAWHMDVASMKSTTGNRRYFGDNGTKSYLGSYLTTSSQDSALGSMSSSGKSSSLNGLVPISTTTSNPELSTGGFLRGMDRFTSLSPSSEGARTLDQADLEGLPRQYTLDEYKRLKILLKRRTSKMHILPPVVHKRLSDINMDPSSGHGN